jgi:hypothetical protein
MRIEQNGRGDSSNVEEVNKFEEEVEDATILEHRSKRDLKMINDSALTQQVGCRATGGGGASGQ